MPYFSFQSADFKDRLGRRIRLGRAVATVGNVGRKPVQFQFMAQVGVDSLLGTVEMSRREAYAFSEWLDTMATQTTAKRRSQRDQENEK